MPFATDVKLFGECLFPVLKELLSFWKAFARIDNFVPFCVSNSNWFSYYNFLVLSLIHNCILRVDHSLVYNCLRCLNWRNCWLTSKHTNVSFFLLSRSASATTSWNCDFFWVLSLSLSFCSYGTWFSNAIIIHERSDIRNRKSSSSISAQWSIRLFNSLFIPSNKLSPNVLTIVLFIVFVHMFTLIFFVHQSSLFMSNIAVSDQHNIGITFSIILILSKVCFSVSIHH